MRPAIRSHQMAQSGSGGSPAIPAQNDLLIWLKADAIEGASDGDFLSTWVDSSSHARVLSTPGLGVNRPRYNTGIINGLPAVHFGHHIMNAYFNVANVGSHASGELLMVIRSDADPIVGAKSGPDGFNDSTTAGDSLEPNTLGSLSCKFASDTAQPNIQKPTSLSSSFRLVNVVSESGKMRVFYDGTLLFAREINAVDWGVSANHTIGRGVSGAGETWPGYVAEFMVWDRALTSEEREQAKAVLADKYSLTVTTDPSTFTPNTIDTNIVGWWDASQLVGLSDNDGIASLPDLSSAGNDWAQATGASQPIYKTGVYNGLPTIRFDGTKFFDGVSWVVPANGAYTVVAVGLPNADGSILANNAVNIQIRWIRGGVQVVSAYYNAAPEAISSTFAHSVNTLQMWVWRRTASSVVHNHALNGTVDGNKNGTTNGFTINRFGSHPFGIPLNGDICELAIWDRRLSDAELAKLFQYHFQTKWGLPG